MTDEKRIKELHKFLESKKELLDQLEEAGISSVDDVLKALDEQKAEAKKEALAEFESKTTTSKEENTTGDNTSTGDTSISDDLVKKITEQVASSLEKKFEEKLNPITEKLKKYESVSESNQLDISMDKLVKMAQSGNFPHLKNVITSGNKAYVDHFNSQIKNMVEASKDSKTPLTFEKAVEKMEKTLNLTVSIATGKKLKEEQENDNPFAELHKKTEDNLQKEESGEPKMSGNESKISHLFGKNKKTEIEKDPLAHRDEIDKLAEKATSIPKDSLSL